MPIIRITTIINAPIEVVFDLSRSIDLHQISTSQTNERAIAGRTAGLIELGESVAWEAKHFGVTQQLTSKITAYQRPDFFVDEMTKGIFTRMHHRHQFKAISPNTTEMVDTFDYTSPLAFLGKLADTVFLENYMRNLLVKRNDCIKQFAESGKWKDLV